MILHVLDVAGSGWSESAPDHAVRAVGRVSLSVRSVCLFVLCLYARLSACLSVCLFCVCMPVCEAVHPSVCLFVCSVSVLPVQVPVCVWSSIHPFVCLFGVCMPIQVPVCVVVHPSVCLFVLCPFLVRKIRVRLS